MAKILTRKGTTITSSPAQDIDVGNQKLINVGNPSNPQDVVTLDYFDSNSTAASEAFDGTFRIKNTADNTKEIAFDASGVTTATTRTVIMPDANVDLGLVASAIQDSEKGSANGVATLNANGKLTNGQIPFIAITETFVVADITARDALTVGTGDNEVSEGDVAIVGDASADVDVNSGGASYIWDGAAWKRLKNPDDVVQSVNGNTGTVVLDSDDISEGSTNLYYTSARFDTDFSGKSTDDLSEGASNLYFTEARVLASVLTGLSTASNDSVEATDDILAAIGKLQARTKKNNYTASVDPTASDDSSLGYEIGSRWYNTSTDKLYIAEGITAGSAVWQLINPDAPVDSVNGETGAVVLDTDNISEGVNNLYYTDARAKAAAVSDDVYDASGWDGVTDVAPSKNAVRDELETKADASTVSQNTNDISTLQSESGLAFQDGVIGEALGTNQLYLVRRAKAAETSGRYYLAQADSFENSRVVGFVITGGTAPAAGDSLRIFKLGEGALGSGDANFTASTDENKIIYLDQSTAGKWTLNPSTTSGTFLKEVGFVATSSSIEFQPGLAIEN